MKGTLLGLFCVAVLSIAAAPAWAGGPHYRHHPHYGGSGVRANFFIGGAYPVYRPYWRPVYYPAPVYYYPPPAYVAPAPVVVAPPPPPVVAPSFSFWFGR